MVRNFTSDSFRVLLTSKLTSFSVALPPRALVLEARYRAPRWFPRRASRQDPAEDEDPALLEVPAFKVTLLFPSPQKGSLQFLCGFKITWELWPKSYPRVFSSREENATASGSYLLGLLTARLC